MLVAQEAVAREGVCRRQRYRNRDYRVDDDVGNRVDVAVVPGRVGEDLDVVAEREVLWPQGEHAEDLVGGLERHVQQPIDRQHQEQDVEGRHEPLVRLHHSSSLRIIRV